MAPPAAPPAVSAASRSPLLLTPSPPPVPPRAAPQTGRAHLQYLSWRIAVHPASRTTSITEALFRTIRQPSFACCQSSWARGALVPRADGLGKGWPRGSAAHTPDFQSRADPVCRLLRPE